MNKVVLDYRYRNHLLVAETNEAVFVYEARDKVTWLLVKESLLQRDSYWVELCDRVRCWPELNPLRHSAEINRLKMHVQVCYSVIAQLLDGQETRGRGEPVWLLWIGIVTVVFHVTGRKMTWFPWHSVSVSFLCICCPGNGSVTDSPPPPLWKVIWLEYNKSSIDQSRHLSGCSASITSRPETIQNFIPFSWKLPESEATRFCFPLTARPQIKATERYKMVKSIVPVSTAGMEDWLNSLHEMLNVSRKQSQYIQLQCHFKVHPIQWKIVCVKIKPNRCCFLLTLRPPSQGQGHCKWYKLKSIVNEHGRCERMWLNSLCVISKV